MFSYLRRDRYHCPITIINIVRTKGKAGYLVWKLAGGQGDQDINLPWGSFEITFFFNFLDVKLSVANPLLIIKINFNLTRMYRKGVYIIWLNFICFYLNGGVGIRTHGTLADTLVFKSSCFLVTSIYLLSFKEQLYPKCTRFINN